MSTGTYETILADAKIAMRLWETHPELKLNDITLVAFQKTEKNFESVLDDARPYLVILPSIHGDQVLPSVEISPFQV